MISGVRASSIRMESTSSITAKLSSRWNFSFMLNASNSSSVMSVLVLAAGACAAATGATASAGDGLISDHEFESLLDELHGKGKFSEVAPAAAVATAAPVAAKAATPAPATKPAAAPAAAPAPAPARAAAAPVAEKPASEAETTVRVDTARLDDIMNMVGELVLVRNRRAAPGPWPGRPRCSSDHRSRPGW